MSPQSADALNRRLESYEQQSGHQILVYIGQTTDGVPIEDWAVRAFENWKVGRKGMDDGLVLFIMAQDRRLRIEVGYGLEGQIPDALASFPEFRRRTATAPSPRESTRSPAWSVVRVCHRLRSVETLASVAR